MAMSQRDRERLRWVYFSGVVLLMLVLIPSAVQRPARASLAAVFRACGYVFHAGASAVAPRPSEEDQHVSGIRKGAERAR